MIMARRSTFNRSFGGPLGCKVGRDRPRVLFTFECPGVERLAWYRLVSFCRSARNITLKWTNRSDLGIELQGDEMTPQTPGQNLAVLRVTTNSRSRSHRCGHNQAAEEQSSTHF